MIIAAAIIAGVLFVTGLIMIPRISMREVNYDYHQFDENTYDFENEVSIPAPEAA